MLGLGELIFVLVIVVQGVAAIAAASQKKKKRAAARAQEIAAEEGRPGSSQASPALTRQMDEETRLDRVRAVEERQARKALKQQKREAQFEKLRSAMESSTAKSMTEAVSMLTGLSPATKEPGASARNDQASASPARASAGSAGLPAGRGIPPLGSSVTIARRPPVAPPAPGQIAADEAAFAAFQKKGRKPKASPFGGDGAEPGPVGGSSAAGSTRPGLTLRGTLRNRRALRQAFVLKTLLEPPVALRDEAETAG